MKMNIYSNNNIHIILVSKKNVETVYYVLETINPFMTGNTLLFSWKFEHAKLVPQYIVLSI